MGRKIGVFAPMMALIATLSLLGGCVAKMQFNYKPQTVKLPSGSAEGDALVLGQAYMRGVGDWVEYLITAVDDTRTLSPMAVRPDINLYVPSGRRTLTVKVLIGNSLHWGESQGGPKITTTLRAGMVYQVHARVITDIRGKDAVEVWLERVGSVAQYEAYMRNHPGQAGRPMPVTQSDASENEQRWKN